MLVIHWRSGPSKGYSDLYPSAWFAHAGTQSQREHNIRGPRGGNYPARCSVRVEGSVVDLDYGGKHSAFNKKQHYLGVLRIVFTDSVRTDVDKVLWRVEGTHEFTVEDVDVYELEVPLEGLDDFDPANMNDGRRKIEQMVVLRQGQAQFRQALMEAYEGRCAISGCDVREVLEAAHIMPYLGDETNNVRNGLLLRADLHTLFDLGLLKIGLDYKILAEPRIVEAFNLPSEVINLPSAEHQRPSPRALAEKWAELPTTA